MSLIEKALMQVCGTVIKAGSDRQAYLFDLIDKVDKALGDDDVIWNTLSSEVQEYLNKAISQFHATKVVPDFPDKEEIPEISNISVEEEDPSPPKTKRPYNKKKVSSDTEKSSEIKKSKKATLTGRTKFLTLKHPTKSLAYIKDLLTKEGFSFNENRSLKVIYNEAHYIYSMLEDLGKLKEVKEN